MEISRIKIIMLCGKGSSSRTMYHGLNEHVDIVAVILEEKPSPSHLVKRRIKKLGFLKVIGQLLFILFNKIVSPLSAKRISFLMTDFMLKNHAIPKDVIQKVKSVNSQETINLIKKHKPDAIVVNGTRIISYKVLSSVKTPFLNTHMGITPKYRGIHCGYWAMAMKDEENCGVTVHLVDKGIDTGGVLYQARISPTKSDNFNTYPIHQISKGIELMKLALKDVAKNDIKIIEGIFPSTLWSHPTLFEYLRNWLKKGIN
jgi:folate-dependent phosphoribosylglycinamide formyltransferase PurN